MFSAVIRCDCDWLLLVRWNQKSLDDSASLMFRVSWLTPGVYASESSSSPLSRTDNSSVVPGMVR